ncbi:MAG: PAAR domain-containing protein [Anaerolineaceae bacterium]|nr:PAAR domain-containing protein [Anaerolineaceae bacterium]
MPFPAARMGDQTASGDTIVGPGMPTVLIEGQPASVMGDTVTGAACVGTVTVGSPTVLIGNRPATRVTSAVAGNNPVTGVPVATTVMKGAVKTLIA